MVDFNNDGWSDGVFVKAVQAGGKTDDIGIKPGDLIKELASVSLYITAQDTTDSAKDKSTKIHTHINFRRVDNDLKLSTQGLPVN